MCNDKSMPIHRDAIESAGFDYVALGHIHNRFDISDRIVYSGCLEPLNRGETGPKGYIIGTIEKPGAGPSKLQWEFVPCAKREYVLLPLEVTVQTTELSLCEKLLEAMENRGLQHMYLAVLQGTRAREMVWNPEAIITTVRNRGGYLLELRDETLPDIPVEQLREEQKDTLVGRFIERMDLVEDEELRGLALQYGLQALLARDEKK